MEIEEITEINVTILQATNCVSLDAPAMAAVALREALGALRPHIALQESEQAEFEKKRIAERSGVEQ